jgi:hypothetical protein
VACPLCGTQFSVATIEQHASGCLGA